MFNRNPYLAIDQKIVGDIYTSNETMNNLEVLCDEFGSRFGGTPGERQAVEFFQIKMNEYGLVNVNLEPFEYVGWKRGQTKLAIISPIRKEIPCISLPHSPPTELQGVIIDMGDGAPNDFDNRAKEIEGKVVMTTSVTAPKGSKRWIHRMEKYARSIMAGATGFIFVNHYPGLGPATGVVGENFPGTIPGISISKEDGAFIQRLAKRKGEVRIHLTSSDRCEKMTSWNIVGEILGCKKPEQIVMLGSHYDGHDISQGAEDPASGAVVVLEAARVLAKFELDLECTIRFVLWGVEEIGMIGSKEYVRSHRDELSNIRFCLNMDAAGRRTDNRNIILHEWPVLEELFQKWRKDMALDFAISQKVNSFSDHFPFFLNGVPTGEIETVNSTLEGRGYGHTQYDTVDKVGLVGLREASTLVARLALRIANKEDWPATKRTEETVMVILNGPDYKAEMEYKKRYNMLQKSA